MFWVKNNDNARLFKRARLRRIRFKNVNLSFLVGFLPRFSSHRRTSDIETKPPRKNHRIETIRATSSIQYIVLPRCVHFLCIIHTSCCNLCVSRFCVYNILVISVTNGIDIVCAFTILYLHRYTLTVQYIYVQQTPIPRKHAYDVWQTNTHAYVYVMSLRRKRETYRLRSNFFQFEITPIIRFFKKQFLIDPWTWRCTYLCVRFERAACTVWTNNINIM